LTARYAAQRSCAAADGLCQILAKPLLELHQTPRLRQKGSHGRNATDSAAVCIVVGVGAVVVWPQRKQNAEADAFDQLRAAILANIKASNGAPAGQTVPAPTNVTARGCDERCYSKCSFGVAFAAVPEAQASRNCSRKILPQYVGINLGPWQHRRQPFQCNQRLT